MRTGPRHSMHQPGQRQLRVGELLRRRLAELFARAPFEESALQRGCFVLTEVRLSADLKWARAYVMPLGARDMTPLVEALNEHAAALRRQMVQGLRLKFAPHLRFVADDSVQRAQKLDALLRSPAVRRDLAQPRRHDG